MDFVTYPELIQFTSTIIETIFGTIATLGVVISIVVAIIKSKK